MTAVELSEDDAMLILNALAAYRKACSRQANERITDLQARIIWREEPVDPVTYWHDIQRAGRRP